MGPRLVAVLVFLWLTAGCVMHTQPRRPPPVVVVGPPPTVVYVPRGQGRAAEVHERNAARKAAHEAEKAERKHGKHEHGHHGHDDDDDDDRGEARRE